MEVRSVYNATLYPLPIEQEGERIAARYSAARPRIIKCVAVTGARRYQRVRGIFCCDYSCLLLRLILNGLIPSYPVFVLQLPVLKIEARVRERFHCPIRYYLVRSLYPVYFAELLPILVGLLCDIHMS
jgi:hypothetical protein